MKPRKIIPIILSVGALAGATFGIYQYKRKKDSFCDDDFPDEEETETESDNEKDAAYWMKSSEKWQELYAQRAERESDWQKICARWQSDYNNCRKTCEDLKDEVHELKKLKEKNAKLCSDNEQMHKTNEQLHIKNQALEDNIQELNNKIEQAEFYRYSFSQRDYLQALLAIWRSQKANIAFIQNTLKIPNSTASELVQYLEDRKIISAPLNGSRSRREILFDIDFLKSEWAAYGCTFDNVVNSDENLKEAQS